MSNDSLKRFERLAAHARREESPRIDIAARVMNSIQGVRPASDPLVETDLAWFAALSLSLALAALVIGWNGSFETIETYYVWLQPFSSAVQQS